MKKVLYFASVLFCAALFSCEKEDIGGTETESMAGDWYVTVEAVDENGNVVDPDFNGKRVHMMTYNTAANSASEMYVDDLGAPLPTRLHTARKFPTTFRLPMVRLCLVLVIRTMVASQTQSTSGWSTVLMPMPLSIIIRNTISMVCVTQVWQRTTNPT